MKISKQKVLYMLNIGMELCWLYLLLTFLNSFVTAGRYLNIAGLCLVYPAAFLFNKGLYRFKWGRRLSAIANPLFATIALLAVIKIQLYVNFVWIDKAWLLEIKDALKVLFWGFQPEFLAILAVFFLWWRGWHLSRSPVNFYNFGTSFQLGMIAMLIVLFVAAQLGVSAQGAYPIVIAFFPLALGGIFLSRSGGSSVEATLFQARPWLWIVLATTCGVMAIGLLIAWIATPDLFNLLQTTFDMLWIAVIKIIYFLAHLFPTTEPEELPLPTLMPLGQGGMDSTVKLLKLPEWIRDAYNILITVLFVGGMGYIIVLALIGIFRFLTQITARLFSAKSNGDIEGLEGGFWADVLGFLNRLLGILLPFRFLTWLGIKRLKGVHSTSKELASIRDIYRHLLRWGAAKGYPRHHWETPYEYLNILSVAAPNMSEELGCVTEGYVLARYGQHPPGKGLVDTVRQSWNRVEKSHLTKSRLTLKQGGSYERDRR